MKFSQLSIMAAALSTLHFVGCSSSATHATDAAKATIKIAPPPAAAATDSSAAHEPEVPVLPWEQIDRRQPEAAETLLEQLSTKTATPAMRLLTRYVEADIWSTRDAVKSCALWTDLFTHVKAEKDFPLMPVAKLHAAQVCASPDAGASAQSDLPWLRELQARTSLKIALRTHDANREMRASSEIASFEKIQKERVRLIQRAIALAVQLKEDSLKDQYQAQLEKTAPRFIEQPAPEQRMMVAGDFKQARQFDQARKLYQAIFDRPDSSDVEKSRALEGIRMSYKLQKNTPRFLAATEAFANFAREAFYFPVELAVTKPAKKRHPKKKLTRAQLKKLAKSAPSAQRGSLHTLPRFMDAQITYARAVWTEHNPKLAEEILSKAEADVAGRASTAESAWIRARIAEEAGNLDHALNIFAQIDANKVENPDLKTKIFWNNAWDSRKANRKEDAIAKLKLLTEDHSIPNATRAQFWLARTLHDLGKEKEATAQYEQLIAADPMGIYGLLAYRELKRSIPPAAAGSDDKTAANAGGDTKQNPHSELKLSYSSKLKQSLRGETRFQFNWLAAAGENELAQTFLDQITISQRASFNEAQTLDLLQLYAKAGSYQTLFARLNDLAPTVRAAILQNHPELLFPQPWHSIASESARNAGIPIELIYSIMRQESSFNPNARSFADAFGLMQLIPEVAERAGKSIGVTLTAHEDLFDPMVSIPVGATFLHQLLTHWHGQFVLAVASYNANESAIAGWVKTRYKTDPLEFIEDIPYEETRSYIKLVLRNFIFYSRLNSGGQALPFPEHCLENIQAAKP